MNEYAIVVVPLSEDDGGGYIAHVPDLPGCVGDGDTRADAVSDAEMAIAAWLEACEAEERIAPSPGSSLEKARKREDTLFDLLHNALDLAEARDGEIRELKGKIETMYRLMQSERDPRAAPYETLTDSLSTSKTHH